MIKKYSDVELEEKIETLKKIVDVVIKKHELGDTYCFFTNDNDEPNECPCVLILSFDGNIHSAMNGYLDIYLSEDINQALDLTEFFFELIDSTSGGFYLKDDESDLSISFRDYFEWRWICDLIKPDYSALYEEIFDRFRRRPDDLYKLSPRQFEEFLDIVFINNGYRTELGKGSNDGGVDLKIYANDVVGESVTLVQAKRYKAENPIDLQAVQALTAVVDDQKANRGLFVTTSRYLPCAEKFTARQNSRIQLASSKEVAEWCHSASSNIIKDKSTLIEFNQIKKLLQETEGRKLLHARYGYDCTNNEYGLIVKETKGSALILSLPAKIHTHDGYGQNGTNLPDINGEFLTKDKLHIFRVKKVFDENNEFKYFYGVGKLFSFWDGKPNYFNSD
jgi:hypothetical protein